MDENDKQNKNSGIHDENKEEDNYLTIGMSMGMCLGLTVGQLVLKNIGLGMSIGMCLGLAIGVGIKKKK